MTTVIVRKTTLALMLAVLSAGVGRSLAQVVRTPIPPTHPSPDDPVGGNPDPTCGGGCLVAVH